MWSCGGVKRWGQGGGKGGEGERVLLSDLSSDLLKGKVDKVLAADAADALEVTWLGRSVAVTHVMLRQHILAAHGYAVSRPAPLASRRPATCFDQRAQHDDWQRAQHDEHSMTTGSEHSMTSTA